jgi:transposase
LGPVGSRCDVHPRKKRGDEIGNTKCGKGMKLEVVTDANGIPLGTKVAAANRAETDLIEEALDDIPVPLPELPEGSLPIPMVVDRGYDCDPLRDRLLERGIEMLSPHRSNRKKPSRNDGRRMRRYSRRYVIERTNSWLHGFRRVAVRHEYYSFIYHGFVRLACIIIAVNQL